MKTESLILDGIEPTLTEMQAIALQAPGSSPYQIAHFFQKTTGYTMFNTGLLFHPEDKPDLGLEVFCAKDEINRISYFLIPNHTDTQIWNNDFPVDDHWLILEGPGISVYETAPLIQQISEIPCLFNAVEIPLVQNRKGLRLKFFEDFYMFLVANDLCLEFE